MHRSTAVVLCHAVYGTLIFNAHSIYSFEWKGIMLTEYFKIAGKSAKIIMSQNFSVNIQYIFLILSMAVSSVFWQATRDLWYSAFCVSSITAKI